MNYLKCIALMCCICMYLVFNYYLVIKYLKLYNLLDDYNYDQYVLQTTTKWHITPLNDDTLNSPDDANDGCTWYRYIDVFSDTPTTYHISNEIDIDAMCIHRNSGYANFCRIYEFKTFSYIDKMDNVDDINVIDDDIGVVTEFEEIYFIAYYLENLPHYWSCDNFDIQSLPIRTWSNLDDMSKYDCAFLEDPTEPLRIHLSRMRFNVKIIAVVVSSITCFGVLFIATLALFHCIAYMNEKYTAYVQYHRKQKMLLNRHIVSGEDSSYECVICFDTINACIKECVQCKSHMCFACYHAWEHNTYPFHCPTCRSTSEMTVFKKCVLASPSSQVAIIV